MSEQTRAPGLRNQRGVRTGLWARGTAPAAVPYCRSCGTRNDADARFRDGCGAPIA